MYAYAVYEITVGQISYLLPVAKTFRCAEKKYVTNFMQNGCIFQFFFFILANLNIYFAKKKKFSTNCFSHRFL